MYKYFDSYPVSDLNSKVRLLLTIGTYLVNFISFQNKSAFQDNAHLNTLGIIFDLVIKYDHHLTKLVRAHSQKANAPGQDPRLVAFWVLEKTVFKEGITIYECGSNQGHGSTIS